jgi:hypothetical protein
MTEQTAATPPPAKSTGAAAPAKEESPHDLVVRLRAELAMAQAALPQEPGTVRLRVREPHDSFTVGGVTVGADPTPVPVHALTGLMSAAADAGVTLEED